MYDGTMVGVPYDIPVFIMMYRDDVYKELGLSVPKTFDQYMSNSQKIQAAKLGHLNPDGRPIYGTNGQMKSGHYSLECDWTMFAWAFGGSITNPDGIKHKAAMYTSQYTVISVNGFHRLGNYSVVFIGAIIFATFRRFCSAM
jgi:ABC-type glycerol-3-phosphate transport system substrate-binding protein